MFILILCFVNYVLVFLGLATSFFNDKNKNIVRDLVDILMEAKQEVPTWLESMSYEARHTGGTNRRPQNKRLPIIFVTFLNKYQNNIFKNNIFCH